MQRLGSSRSRAITRQPEAFALLSDRSAARTNPWAIGTATAVNGGIAALVILLGMRAAAPRFPPPANGPQIEIGDLPIFAPPAARPANGGSGGGTNDAIDPSRGRPPQFSATPIAPPMVPIVEQPRLAEESTVAIRLPDDSSLPNLGVKNSPNVTSASNGPGTHSGIGWGANGGDGPGDGDGGWGPGSGNTIYVPGHGVMAPTVVYAPEAEFSDEARRQKYQGVCMISVVVDAHGNPRNLRVIRPLGMGLDEKALAAVRGYRFKPGTKDGKPVPVTITVEVDFRLF
jgi:TonB family protein